MTRLTNGPSSIPLRLRVLGYNRYADYLRSAHWKELKRAYRASGLPQKCKCGARATEMHHKTYARLGHELLSDLQPVCRACHERLHRKPKLKHLPEQRPRKRQKNKKRKGCAGTTAPDWTDTYRQGAQ